MNSRGEPEKPIGYEEWDRKSQEIVEHLRRKRWYEISFQTEVFLWMSGFIIALGIYHGDMISAGAMIVGALIGWLSNK